MSTMNSTFVTTNISVIITKWYRLCDKIKYKIDGESCIIDEDCTGQVETKNYKTSRDLQEKECPNYDQYYTAQKYSQQCIGCHWFISKWERQQLDLFLQEDSIKRNSHRWNQYRLCPWVPGRARNLTVVWKAKLIREKQLEVGTSCSYGEAGTVCMVKVEQPDCCKFYCEQSYNAIILSLLIQKVWTGHCWPQSVWRTLCRTSA